MSLYKLSFSIFLAALVACLFAGTLARADTVQESEPNDTPAQANQTVGSSGVSIEGELSTAADVDHFTFEVTKLGIASGDNSTAVRLLVKDLNVQSTALSTFTLTHESGEFIFDNILYSPAQGSIFDFNAFVTGVYTLKLGSATAPLLYSVEIYGVADGDGVPPEVVGTKKSSPTELIRELRKEVRGLNLRRGIKNSYDTKLSSALRVLNDLKSGNDHAAINNLYAFIAHVDAQSGKMLGEEEADYLIAKASEIIEILKEGI